LANFISGFSLGLSLIMAIGAQNAFVLKSGLRREHIFIICTLCAVSDAVLIAAGILGFGSLLDAVPSLEIVMRLAGACFLSVYGCKSFLSAWRGGTSLQATGACSTLLASVLTCLALTWLNPHVYLDTVVLLGSIAAQHDDRFIFGVGAVSASFVFFYTLGFGARLLAPVFSQPVAWRILDACVGALMWAIAIHLFFN
jgi:L-lysine exporter family protein LysE/ArgO